MGQLALPRSQAGLHSYYSHVTKLWLKESLSCNTQSIYNFDITSMAFPLFRYNLEPENPQQPPLRIIVMPRDVEREGFWRPEAFVALTKTLRDSGFLMALPPEDLKSLLVMLTFLSPNGHCIVRVQQLATVFHLSPKKTRLRMNRLVDYRWLDQPIIRYHRAESGVETYALLPGFLPLSEERVQPLAQPVLKSAGREAVIEHSRRKYARTREEVEAEIAQLNNWKPIGEKSKPLDPQTAKVREALVAAGLMKQQADDLLDNFDIPRIERQLEWLPLREARSPVGFLLSAIKNDYEAPPGWKPETPQQPKQPIEPPQELSDEDEIEW